MLIIFATGLLCTPPLFPTQCPYSYWHCRFSNKSSCKLTNMLCHHQVDSWVCRNQLTRPPCSDRSNLFWSMKHEQPCTKVKLIGRAQERQSAGQARWKACVPLVSTALGKWDIPEPPVGLGDVSNNMEPCFSGSSLTIALVLCLGLRWSWRAPQGRQTMS